MLVNTPLKTKTLVDYDFNFEGGNVMPVTVDADAGDTVSNLPEEIHIWLAPKASKVNPDKNLPGERITIFKGKLLAIQQRERVITELNPEEKAEWKQILHKLSPNIQ